ncbi:TPA: SH3 domain-containing protein [Pseudomonas aeruginosa]|uniref:Bacterial SH3 domain protein n=3 Tax=Pseudomonas aeruginosa group TaxID=136841 RepID=A0A2R3IVM9_9PSED|nr:MULTISPECIES: SH3 domain-containing protein [Pseudomonas aeruginosa group]AVK05985.1 bacterial SH3 domain protein [Pseudomonas paraeruginosa]KSD65765.1 SH3 domain-containing protein [Pseudomonas aeruginosa]MCT9630648.1 SH3 domain-containing protein [Pseudomonas aeruginosa]HCE6465898.1 SH3 domain-containing protein [Pseudomonas aeruginosa]
MTGSKKDLLRKIQVISPMDEIREQIAALSTPSYLAQIQEQMKALTNPSYLTQLRAAAAAVADPSYLAQAREAAAALANPLHMTQMREEIATLTNPSYLTQLRAAAAAVADPSYLAQAREAAAALANPLHMTQMREEIATLTNPSHLTQLRAAAAAVADLSYVAQARETAAALVNPLHMTQMREEIAALTNPSHLTQLRAAAATLAHPSYLAQMREVAATARMQKELSAVLGSYQDLIRESALASYLVTSDDENAPSSQRVEAEGFDSLEVGDFAALESVPTYDVDLEIVQALSEGHPESLSLPATQRLQFVYLKIVAIWDMLLRIFNTCMALIYLTALMSNATVPADVPKQAAQLPNYERQLLADSYRIVNRNGARLRAEPSKKAEIILQLQLGAVVEVEENNGEGWLHVVAEYQDESVEGWIHLTLTSPVPPPKYHRGQIVDADNP